MLWAATTMSNDEAAAEVEKGTFGKVSLADAFLNGSEIDCRTSIGDAMSVGMV